MLRHLLGDADRFVIVDVETSGLYNSDRIVELAAVTLDAQGETIDEWDTLVDPQRDVGPVQIHHITASMVSAAPLFAEIAGVLARRLDGAVMVAHNLQFDSRMLSNEFARARGAFSPGLGICTLRLAGTKLSRACERYAIEHRAHQALGDARACADLLRTLADKGPRTTPAAAACTSAPPVFRTLRRECFDAVQVPVPPLARIASKLHLAGAAGPTLEYLDMLDYALADFVITEDESHELAALASELGLTEQQIAEANRRYMDEFIEAAARDGMLTDAERHLLARLATALGFDPDSPGATINRVGEPRDSVDLRDGMSVCFTGAATDPDGRELTRENLTAMAQQHGLLVMPSVTKHCDCLVAADASTQSGKAAKARRYGIPIISVAMFVDALGRRITTVTNGNS